MPELDTIIPDKATAPYNMQKVIKASSMTAFSSRQWGSTPPVLSPVLPTLTAELSVSLLISPCRPLALSISIAADKASRFIRFCDLFNIPVVALGDCPGYMIGSEQDWRGILRHGAKLLFAWADATVPIISVMLRKSYAGAHFGMLDKSIGADFVLAWPTARVTIVGAETAASVIFAREIRESKTPEETKAARIKEYSDLYENAYVAADRNCVDEIIMPHDTRKMINRLLDILEDKNKNNKAFNKRVWRKYANINL